MGYHAIKCFSVFTVVTVKTKEKTGMYEPAMLATSMLCTDGTSLTCGGQRGMM
jgi:hypothetical protein